MGNRSDYLRLPAEPKHALRYFSDRSELIEPGVSPFAHLAYGTHLAEAVGNPLGHPAMHLKGFGQVTCVEWLRHRTHDQPSQVGGRPETVGGMHGHEFLVFDLVVGKSPTATTTVTRITPLLDVNQGHLQRQPLVGKHPGEMNQFVEQIEERASLGAYAPVRDRSILARPLYEQLLNDDRLDHHNGVVVEQGFHLIADRSQRCGHWLRCVLLIDGSILSHHLWGFSCRFFLQKSSCVAYGLLDIISPPNYDKQF